MVPWTTHGSVRCTPACLGGLNGWTCLRSNRKDELMIYHPPQPFIKTRYNRGWDACTDLWRQDPHRTKFREARRVAYSLGITANGEFDLAAAAIGFSVWARQHFLFGGWTIFNLCLFYLPSTRVSDASSNLLPTQELIGITCVQWFCRFWYLCFVHRTLAKVLVWQLCQHFPPPVISAPCIQGCPAPVPPSPLRESTDDRQGWVLFIGRKRGNRVQIDGHVGCRARSRYVIIYLII